jgi:hypothetical protein
MRRTGDRNFVDKVEQVIAVADRRRRSFIKALFAQEGNRHIRY